MTALRAIRISPEEKECLGRQYSKLPETLSFLESPGFAARVASLGIAREVGTVNDQLARFIFNAETGAVVPLESLRSEIVEWRAPAGVMTGVKIWSESARTLDLRARGMVDLLHPDFSFDMEGRIRQLVIFPELVARILAAQGIDAVLVKPWGRNSIFGGFDPSEGYYQTNFWELENNDSLLFSALVSEGKLALLGTHDLIAHAAGANLEAWAELRPTARRVREAIAGYLGSVAKPSIAALILPYTIGVVLDDLAQPPTYGSRGHLAVLEELLRELERGTVPADLPTFLREFPATFEKIIRLSREAGIEREPGRIRECVAHLSREILAHSVRIQEWPKRSEPTLEKTPSKSAPKRLSTSF